MSINQNNQVQEYIRNVCSHIKNRKVHQEIQIELLGHIEEIALEHLSTGATEDEAVNKAIIQMGEAGLVGIQLNEIHKTQPDWSILILTAIMAGLGLFAMYLIETKGALLLSYQIFNRSLFSTLLGIAVICGLYFFDYRKLQPYSKYIYIGTLLILLYVVYYGTQINGAKAWLTIGQIRFNFVQISPFLFIIALAGLFDNWNWNDPKKVLYGLALSIVPVVFILDAPSFSAGVTYLIAFVVLMVVSGLKVKYIPLLAGSGFGLFLFAGITAPYRIMRLLAFINPNQDPLGAGYINVQLNKITHSAGFLGQGFNFPKVIPEVHTDFVFTYIIHTFGWIAGVILAALIITFIMKLTHTATIVKNNYGKLLVSGFVTIFAVQFFWNILMNLGLAPISGVGLPFISYGGSQFVFSMLAVGVITNIYKWRNAPQISVEIKNN
ncbi:MAG: FtsW/RodA/SpoVE family cell cycle protein [Thermincola sp.]|jgi:cell division protein FtsW (lipid II flippase)|nr:FtsW/RodA/SpoVE family cell cycle protein [Thermincola sp.]